jgi:hypothetical protein
MKITPLAALALSATLLASGCYRTIITNGKPVGKVARDGWHHGTLLGSIELSGPYSLDKSCGGQSGSDWAQLSIQTSASNTIVGTLAGFNLLYTPQSTLVACAGKPGAKAAPKPKTTKPPTKLPPPKPPTKTKAAIKPGTVIAVFDVADPSGILKAPTLEALSEYLAAQLTATAGAKVVPRAQLRKRLVKERKNSYKRCFDESCQIEMGKAVAAQKSLATKILRVGKLCAIAASLFDLRSETTEGAATVDTSCKEDALLAGIKALVRKLAGK